MSGKNPKGIFRQSVEVFVSNRLAVVGLSILIVFTLFSFVGLYLGNGTAIFVAFRCLSAVVC